MIITRWQIIVFNHSAEMSVTSDTHFQHFSVTARLEMVGTELQRYKKGEPWVIPLPATDESALRVPSTFPLLLSVQCHVYMLQALRKKNRPVRKTDWPPSQRYHNCLPSCIFSSAEPLVCVKWPCTLIQRVSLFYFAVQNSGVSTSRIYSRNSVVTLLFRVVPAFFFFSNWERNKEEERRKWSTVFK